MATAASAGPASGSMTRQKVVKKLAPSIRAASSISCGIDRKYWRSRKMLVALMARTRIDAGVLEDALGQPEAVQDQVDGDEPQLVRDHQRRQDDQEEHLATGKPQTREGVAGDAPEDDVADGYGAGDERRC